MKDREIQEFIQEELKRQQDTIELIASENIVSEDPSGLGAGAGSRRRWPSQRGPLRPRMRGSSWP